MRAFRNMIHAQPSPPLSSLEQLPGAVRLQPDDRVTAGCSALVAVPESPAPLPARILAVFDSCYAHVDYAAHGVGRLDEIVELGRLAAVVKFNMPGQGSHSLAPPAGKDFPEPEAEPGPETEPGPEPEQPAEPKPTPLDPEWMAFLQKTSSGRMMSQQQQQLATLKAQLQEAKQKVSSAVSLNFTVDEDLLGLVVGPKGANLMRARQVEGVFSVKIDGSEVQVLAATTEAGEAARDLLEFLREPVPIQSHEASLLIGKGGKNIRDIQTKCQLFSINVCEDCVELLGSRKAVNTAKRAIALVIRFLSTKNDLWHDTKGLIKEVRSIPAALLEGKAGQDGAELDDTAPASGAANGSSNGVQQDGPTYEMQVPQDKVGLLIGVKGAMIREVSERSRCRLDIGNETEMVKGVKMASVFIQPLRAGDALAPNTKLHSKAKPGVGEEPPAGNLQLAIKLITECIDEHARAIKAGLSPGAVLRVRAVKIVDFGAFVALPNGQEGLLHISELDYEHVTSVTDFVSVGDELYVVVLSLDERGRARLSLKDVDQDLGVFRGQLPYDPSTAAGATNSHDDDYSLPIGVFLEDQTAFPSLDGSGATAAQAAQAAPPAAASGSGGDDAKKPTQESRQEWKDRRQQQREKAAQEAAGTDSRPSNGVRAPQQQGLRGGMRGGGAQQGQGETDRHMHAREMRGGMRGSVRGNTHAGRGGRVADGDGRRQEARGGTSAGQRGGGAPTHDLDYRRDAITPGSRGAGRGASGHRPAAVVAVGPPLGRPSDRDGGEGEGEGGPVKSLRSRLSSRS